MHLMGCSILIPAWKRNHICSIPLDEDGDHLRESDLGDPVLFRMTVRQMAASQVQEWIEATVAKELHKKTL